MIIEGPRFDDLIGRGSELGSPVTFVVHVETLQEGETVRSHFLRRQQAIVLDALENRLQTETDPLDPPVRRVLILNTAAAGQAQDEALAELSQVLQEAGTYFAPDSRRLWDEIRFLDANEIAPSLSPPRPIP